MGQCIATTKVVIDETGRRMSETAEEAKAFIESYHARRYHPVSTRNTTAVDTNAVSYDVESDDDNNLVEGEEEINKIFENSEIIDNNI